MLVAAALLLASCGQKGALVQVAPAANAAASAVPAPTR